MASPRATVSQGKSIALMNAAGTSHADLVLAPCPLCEGTETAPAFVTTDEYRNPFPLRSCSRCHTRFLFPRPTDEQLGRAYAVGYYGEGASKFGGLIETLRDFAFAGRARSLSQELNAGARVLDIGCGDGRLLRQLQRFGKDLELHGVELPGPAAERTRAIAGVTLTPGSVDSVDFEDGSFDFISMVHVIEHVPSPLQALQNMARWLKPGGRLLLAFPNIESWQAGLFGAAWFHLDPPRHLSLASPRAMESVLSDLGLELTAQRHFCPEQNIYGWIQSMLNRVDADRNFLYERLKRNRGFSSSRRCALLWQVPAAGLMLPLAVVMDALSALCGRGATVELIFRRNPLHRHVS